MSLIDDRPLKTRSLTHIQRKRQIQEMGTVQQPISGAVIIGSYQNMVTLTQTKIEFLDIGPFS